MKYLRIQGLLLLTSLGAGTVAWFIPDGIAFAIQVTGSHSLQQDTLVHLFSSCFGVLFVYMAGLILWLKAELLDSQRRLYLDIKESVESTINRHVDPSIAVALTRAFSGNENIANTFHSEFSSFFMRLVMANDITRRALKPVIRSLVGSLHESVENILGRRLAIGVADHLEITKTIAIGASNYIQIQQRTFNPKKDWSAEWIMFLDKLAKCDMSRIYIVMIDEATLSKEKGNLVEMKKVLEERGFQLRVCDKQSILDGSQGQLSTDAVIEVFDEELIKLQFIALTGYVGGTTIEVSLIDRTVRPDIWNLLLRIREHSVVFE